MRSTGGGVAAPHSAPPRAPCAACWDDNPFVQDAGYTVRADDRAARWASVLTWRLILCEWYGERSFGSTAAGHPKHGGQLHGAVQPEGTTTLHRSDPCALVCRQRRGSCACTVPHKTRRRAGGCGQLPAMLPPRLKTPLEKRFACVLNDEAVGGVRPECTLRYSGGCKAGSRQRGEGVSLRIRAAQQQISVALVPRLAKHDAALGATCGRALPPRGGAGPPSSARWAHPG